MCLPSLGSLAQGRHNDIKSSTSLRKEETTEGHSLEEEEREGGLSVKKKKENYKHFISYFLTVF